MLQSIILQTIFLSFTLLGCSENRDVCGNRNDEAEALQTGARTQAKRGGEGCYIYSINFYNPENKININNFKIDKNDYAYLANIKTMSYLNFNRYETIEKIKATLKELSITDYSILKYAPDKNCEIEYEETYRNGKLIIQMEMIIRIFDKNTLIEINNKIIEKKLNNIIFSNGKQWISFTNDDLGYEDLHIRFSNDKLEQIEEIMKDLELNYTFLTKPSDIRDLQQQVAVTSLIVAQDAGPPAEEQTEFDVVVSSVGDKKINVIKVVREITGESLKEAKDMVERVSFTVKRGVTKAKAEEIAQILKEAGASVEVLSNF